MVQVIHHLPIYSELLIYPFNRFFVAQELDKKVTTACIIEYAGDDLINDVQEIEYEGHHCFIGLFFSC